MTGNELVAFARGKIGTPYVYGMKGKVLTQKTYDRLRILFGSTGLGERRGENRAGLCRLQRSDFVGDRHPPQFAGLS